MSREKKLINVVSVAIALGVLLVFLLQSCTSGGGGVGGTGVFLQGIMTKGSIIVGDKTLDATSADIVEDDAAVTEDELQNGMKVKIIGELSDDGITGIALSVEAEDEVQGRISSLDAAGNPPSFVVLQQTVFTDDLTVFDNFPGIDPDDINDMVVNQFVEVHGLRDANGDIRATRVELLASDIEPDPEELELKGTVSGLLGFTFFLGTQEVDFSGASIKPAGATISEGDEVEVEGDLSVNVLIATAVEREDLEDEQFEPGEGDEYEIEGYVSGFTSHPGDFNVGTQTVRTSSSTEFKNGSELDLADGVLVEAEGEISGNVLLADEIKFERARVKINAEATASALDSVTVLGLVVQITDLTEVDGALLPLPLSTSTYYKIAGFQDRNGNIIAEKIEPGDSDRIELRALAVGTDAVADTVTLLEMPWSADYDLSMVTEFEDENENPIINVDTFLALITLGETSVEIRDDTPFGFWDKAELED
jgi:hypothetical protein